MLYLGKTHPILIAKFFWCKNYPNHTIDYLSRGISAGHFVIFVVAMNGLRLVFVDVFDEFFGCPQWNQVFLHEFDRFVGAGLILGDFPTIMN